MAEEQSPDQEGMDENLADEEWAAAMNEQEAEPVKLETLTAPNVPEGGVGSDLDLIMDIPVVLSMELGNTDIAIRNLMQLTQGSVVELDRFAGEPLDVLVNGTLIAHGEVVVVNDKYGIRLTDVVSPSERIKRLK